MKARRQMRILQILQDHPVATQEELVEILRREGMDVTQATVSRDIKELQLVKTPGPDGTYRYVLPDSGSETSHLQQRLSRLLRDCVVGTDASENLIVVKTLSGTASAAGEALDRMGWPEVIGTIAGDNTLLLVIKPKHAVPEILARLNGMLA